MLISPAMGPILVRCYRRGVVTAIELSRCYGCGAHNPVGLHLLQHARRLNSEVIIDINLGPFFAGYPGVAHAGVIATMIDECVQIHCHRVLGLVAPTVQLNIAYKAPVPVEAPLMVRGRGVREGRRVLSTAEIVDADGKELATAEVVMVVTEELSAEELERAQAAVRESGTPVGR
jgi:acyl-coenzyme A thioesterase PaaI-like protein